jgi:putative transposase
VPLSREQPFAIGTSGSCSRRPAGDVTTCNEATSPLRFPHRSDYKTRVREYPKVPPRLRWVHPHDPVFFITFCTQQRRKLLGSDAVHTAFVSFGTRAYSEQNVAVGRYVIMPDHVHFFVRRPHDLELGHWVGMLKQTLAKQITPARRLPIWQRGFFDHLLRSDESYAQKWNYVRENPVRAGFVNDPDEWRYSGEIVVIDRA